MARNGHAYVDEALYYLRKPNVGGAIRIMTISESEKCVIPNTAVLIYYKTKWSEEVNALERNRFCQ